MFEINYVSKNVAVVLEGPILLTVLDFGSSRPEFMYLCYVYTKKWQIEKLTKLFLNLFLNYITL